MFNPRFRERMELQAHKFLNRVKERYDTSGFSYYVAWKLKGVFWNQFEVPVPSTMTSVSNAATRPNTIDYL